VSLATKYGTASLDKANVFFGSENDAALPELSRRLGACLKNPLRRFNIGVIGGSMAVPKLDGGCWACNVTRWLDALLSHSWCRSQQDLVASGSESALLPLPACSLPLSTTKEAHVVYQGCSHKRSAFAESPVTFCSPASVFWDPSWGTDATFEQQQQHGKHEEQQEEHQQQHQQLEGGEVGGRSSSSSRPSPSSSLCDESPPKRPCTVHWGTGKHAHVSSGAIGASTTSEAVWMHQRALNQEAGDNGLTLDMVFWDYSTNDMARGGDPLRFAVLLAQLKRSHPTTLAAFLAVFWFDRVGKDPGGKRDNFCCLVACHLHTRPHITSRLCYHHYLFQFENLREPKRVVQKEGQQRLLLHGKVQLKLRPVAAFKQPPLSSWKQCFHAYHVAPSLLQRPCRRLPQQRLRFSQVGVSDTHAFFVSPRDLKILQYAHVYALCQL